MKRFPFTEDPKIETFNFYSEGAKWDKEMPLKKWIGAGTDL